MRKVKQKNRTTFHSAKKRFIVSCFKAAEFIIINIEYQQPKYRFYDSFDYCL